ncbi:MAG: hypothetical protein ACOCVQ_00990 [Bacillota bacterium]
MQRSQLTLKDVLWFFIPLALSGIMMSAGEPIVHSGLARLENPELILAGYGVAFYAAILVEAPIIMLLPASSALVRDDASYRLVRNCMLAINLFLTAGMSWVVLHGPTYQLVFRTILGYPPEVVQTARGAMVFLLLWPGSIGIRRFCQGILIQLGHPQVVSWNTLMRLISMLITIMLGVRLLPEAGVLLGGATLLVGVLVEMLAAMWALHRRLLDKPLPQNTPDLPSGSQTYRGFARFYLPLALTSFAWVLARPLLLSGIARGHMAKLSLAAFPVAMGTMHVLTGHLRMLQQVVVALVKDNVTLDVVKRFSRLVGLVLTVVLAAMAFTPLANLYHGWVIGLRSPTLDMANAALGIMFLMPLLTAIQAFNQGLMIQGEDTFRVNMAAFANLGLLLILLHLGVTLTTVPGYVIGALVMPGALLFEVVLLRRWSAIHIERLDPGAMDSAGGENREG